MADGTMQNALAHVEDYSEVASLRRQLDATQKRLTAMCINCGTAEGALAHTRGELKLATERNALLNETLTAVRGELGDLRDWVDEQRLSDGGGGDGDDLPHHMQQLERDS